MNVDEKIIGKWEKEGVVSAKQAATMRNDLAHVSAEKSSTRWVVAISTIGAILLGIAAIMFISANWQALTRHEKVGLAVLVTFGSFGMGYYLAYVRQNLPKLGNVAIFLSTILFGGTLALISQVYHLDGPPYGLFLLWTLGILPVAYAFRSRAILLLSITVMFITIVLFLGNAKGIGIEEAAAVFQNIATLILVGTLFFAVGSIHKLCPAWEKFGITYRMFGVKLVFFLLFWMTFGEILEELSEEVERMMGRIDLFFPKVISLALIATALMGYSFVKGSAKKLFELGGFAVIVLVMMAYLWAISALVADDVLILTFTGIFNVIFMLGLGVLLNEAYRKNNMKLLNFALFAVGAFIFGKYIQLFDDLLEGSTFFFVSGTVLIVLGVFMEKYRRGLQNRWLQR